jgi:hypothetical protein
MQDTRATVSRFVREYPGRKPAQIAEALQLNPTTIRQTCARMAKDGQIRAGSGGTYYTPEASDSSDTSDVSLLSLCHSTPPEQGEQL